MNKIEEIKVEKNNLERLSKLITEDCNFNINL
jgi:hypothetical protein